MYNAPTSKTNSTVSIFYISTASLLIDMLIKSVGNIKNPLNYLLVFMVLLFFYFWDCKSMSKIYSLSPK